MKQHQLDPNLAQNREAWRKVVMATMDRYKIGKCELSSRVKLEHGDSRAYNQIF